MQHLAPFSIQKTQKSVQYLQKEASTSLFQRSGGKQSNEKTDDDYLRTNLKRYF
jgi:hypothetical protein